MLRRALVIVFALTATITKAGSETPTTPAPAAPSPEDQAREAAVAQFTARQEAMNWPEKFDRIGNEMGVPPDVLAAVAFAETRWEQLTWPPGETVSQETHLPHPYGVMSLWDNDVLGHSLLDAAALIHSTPDALKTDPELNIRGAAALLKKYYDTTPLPEGTSPNDIESWQNAIVKYCGIQDPWLAYHHTVNCYVAMNQGYDQYGMHWKPHPVNLNPMREKLHKLMAEHETHVNHTEPPLEATFERPPEIPPLTAKPIHAAVASFHAPTLRAPAMVWPWFVAAATVVLAIFLRTQSTRKT